MRPLPTYLYKLFELALDSKHRAVKPSEIPIIRKVVGNMELPPDEIVLGEDFWQERDYEGNPFKLDDKKKRMDDDLIDERLIKED